MFTEIIESLSNFRSEFDVFFHENSLYESNEVDDLIKKLSESGDVYQQDSATWVRTSNYGDDKDRVIKKSNGEYSYFAADMAYYINKRKRGADKAVYILGADHHGYIKRMYAIASMVGDVPKENMEIIIGQLVSLHKNGHPIRMGKRTGNIITIEDLVDAMGVDAARYALTRSSMNTPLEIDVDLFTKQNVENPVYYVQYAHARTCSIIRNADLLDVLDEIEKTDISSVLSALETQEEIDLATTLAQFEDVVKFSAETLSTQKINHYLEKLATIYHKWYSKYKVLPNEASELADINKARYFLNKATKTTISNGLHLLGVTSPEKM